MTASITASTHRRTVLEIAERSGPSIMWAGAATPVDHPVKADVDQAR
jgi:hypothetical protein